MLDRPKLKYIRLARIRQVSHHGGHPEKIHGYVGYQPTRTTSIGESFIILNKLVSPALSPSVFTSGSTNIPYLFVCISAVLHSDISFRNLLIGLMIK